MDGKLDRKQYMTNMQRLLENSSLLNEDKTKFKLYCTQKSTFILKKV